MYVNPNVIFISCGETSSDEHMAVVLKFLKNKLPEAHFFGMGGGNLEKEGMELVVDARVSASVMGFTEVVHKATDIYKAFNLLIREVDNRRPALAVLVDYPDFNLRLAKKLKEKGVTVVYFITPQLWAWRRGRIHQIKKYVDTIIPIFPFEVNFYKSFGLDPKFAGHPFTDKPKPKISKEEICNLAGISIDSEILALLPGSRKAEIEKILPALAEVSENLSKTYPNLKCVVPIAPSVKKNVDKIKDNMTCLNFIDGNARELLHVSRAAVVASGTATVEASLSKTPFCICYKVSNMTYLIGKMLIRGVKFIGMPNLIAEREIVKEFIQGNCNSEMISNEVRSLLDNNEYRQRIISDLEKVNKELTPDSNFTASEIVANVIVETLKKLSIYCPYFNKNKINQQNQL